MNKFLFWFYATLTLLGLQIITVVLTVIIPDVAAGDTPRISFLWVWGATAFTTLYLMLTVQHAKEDWS